MTETPKSSQPAHSAVLDSCRELHRRLEKSQEKTNEKYEELREDFIDFRASARSDASTTRDKAATNSDEIKELRKKIVSLEIKLAGIIVITSIASAAITALVVSLVKSVVAGD